MEDNTASTSSAETHTLEANYPFKNEVSLSIGSESSDNTAAPTPSPRHNYQAEIAVPPLEEVALTKPDDTYDGKIGLDNPGYEHEQPKRPLSSFGQNGLTEASLNSAKTQNGKSVDKPLAEAVNLELVNLNKPVNGHDNGIPIKKDTEVDIGDPYDEYFVPVNEHRKYMRGEKLYVTKDKRIKSRWRKWLCWTIVLALLVSLIIIGLLSATGVIFSAKPTPIESRQFNSNEVQASGILGASGSRKNTTETTPITTSSTASYSISITSDENIVYVPNTLEGQLTLQDTEFRDDYNNHNSTSYMNLAQRMERSIKQALKSYMANNNDIYVKVTNMKPGSVVIDYRVGWSNKMQSDISPAWLSSSMADYLKRNNGWLDNYKVPANTLRAARLPDTCFMNPGEYDCDHECKFNEKIVDFTCTCPSNMELQDDGRRCRPRMAVNNDNIHAYELTPNQHSHNDHHDHHDHKQYDIVPQSEPEPTSEAEPQSLDKTENEKEIKELTSTTEDIMQRHKDLMNVQMDDEIIPESEPTSEPEPQSVDKTVNVQMDDKIIPESEPTSEPVPQSLDKTENVQMDDKIIPESEPTSEPEPQSVQKADVSTSTTEGVMGMGIEEIIEKKNNPLIEAATTKPVPSSESQHSTESARQALNTDLLSTNEPESTSETNTRMQMNNEDQTTVQSEPRNEINDIDTFNLSKSSGGVKTPKHLDYDFLSSSTENPDEAPSSELPRTTADNIMFIHHTTESSSTEGESTEAVTTDKPEEHKVHFFDHKTLEALLDRDISELTTTESMEDESRITTLSEEEATTSPSEEFMGKNDASESSLANTSKMEDVDATTVSSPSRGDISGVDESDSAISSSSTENPKSDTVDGTITDRPAPVTEDISDDIPRPTETYFKAPRLYEHKTSDEKQEENSINIFSPRTVDATTTVNESESQQGESLEMSPFLPNIEPSSPRTPSTYAVTENVSEAETFPPIANVVDQSPFLPDIDNNSTLVHNLHQGHDAFVQNDTEEIIKEEIKQKPKSPRLDNDESHKENPVDSNIQTDHVDMINKTSESSSDVMDAKMEASSIRPVEIKMSSSTLVDDEKTTVVEPSTTSATNEKTSSTEEPSSTRGKLDELINFNSESTTEAFKNFINDDNTLKTDEKLTTSATTERLNEIFDPDEKFSKDKNFGDSENDLKVIPLISGKGIKKPDKDEFLREKIKPNEIGEEPIISTTDHFLDEGTFQTTIESTGTSKASDKITPINVMTNESPKIAKSLDTMLMFSQCTSGQFECMNGTSIENGSPCISKTERCDAILHCTDGSDEMDCERLGCPGHFQCTDGPCLSRHLVCDGIAHCNDSSDEKNCSDWQCRFDEISCDASGKGPCIPTQWGCDGLQNCANGRDETNCLDTCSNKEFYCTAQKRCIPEAWRCDGKVDCSESEDERLCDCRANEFKCSTGGCIPAENVCNGQPQCPDLSDEWDCLKIQKNDSNAFGENTLGIRRGNKGQYYYICADSWSDKHSEEICAKLGYANYTSWTEVSLDLLLDPFYALTEMANASLLEKIIQTDFCRKGYVSLTCEEFTCGNRDGEVKNLDELNDEKFIEANVLSTVALAYSESSNLICSTTIVAPRWVLSSYSCIIGRTELVNGRNSDWKIFAGDRHFTRQFNDSMRSVAVKNIYTYPQAKFKQFLYSGDIALLELENNLNLEPKVRTSCVSAQATSTISQEMSCLTAEWDDNPSDENGKDRQLNYLRATMITTDECNSTNIFAGNLPDTSICINQDQIGCKREATPLMCLEKSTKSDEMEWVLRGILSYHGNCGQRQQPKVFTSITSEIQNWITKTIGNNLFH